MFIIGAGASWHYGYPTGQELVRNVVENATLASSYFTTLQPQVTNPACPPVPKFVFGGNGIEPYRRSNEPIQTLIDDCNDIAARLKAVDPVVIDYFLGQNPRLALLGKILIAWAILDAEANSKPRNKVGDPTDHGGNWVKFIIHNLMSGCTVPQSLADNKVTFITFNYDVSLETILTRAIAATEMFSSHGLLETFFGRIPIIHVYGQIRDRKQGILKSLDRKNFSLGKPSEINYNLRWQRVLDASYDAAVSIRTIAPHEKSISDDIEIARKEIREADTVYILGYGFDDHNNRLLDLDSLLRHDGRGRVDSRRTKMTYFTNFENLNTINKRASQLFFGDESLFSHDGRFILKSGCGYEKSTRNVYGAFCYDFNLSD